MVINKTISQDLTVKINYVLQLLEETFELSNPKRKIYVIHLRWENAVSLVCFQTSNNPCLLLHFIFTLHAFLHWIMHSSNCFLLLNPQIYIVLHWHKTISFQTTLWQRAWRTAMLFRSASFYHNIFQMKNIHNNSNCDI